MAGDHVREHGSRRALALVVFAMLLVAAAFAASAAETPDFIRLVRSQGPAVVNISAQQRRRPDAPRMLDEAPDADGVILGSGALISGDGFVLTCAHVVENAQEIVVRLIDRREFGARLIGLDARTDVALLKIDAPGLPATAIGDPAKLEVGEWVLAIGSPFGFSHSATSGIVSAKGRSLPFENYIPFIQTDVAINPGNSGGPLFNLRGEVVGMNSQIYSRSSGFMGVSFAIPIDLAMRVVEQLKREGRYRRGWLGVSLQDVTRGIAIVYNLDRARGALVADILPEGPADRSELLPGDIVLAYDGRAIDTSAQLPLLVSQTRPQSRVRLQVLRRHKSLRDIYVTVGELKSEAPESPPASDKAVADKRVAGGMVVSDLSEERRRQDNLPDGAVLEELHAEARRVGLRAGDVVVEFDGRRVSKASDLRQLLAETPARQVALLRVRRGPQALYFAVAPRP
jgi:serine protease Do